VFIEPDFQAVVARAAAFGRREVEPEIDRHRRDVDGLERPVEAFALPPPEIAREDEPAAGAAESAGGEGRLQVG
jgi:hypothetical protein